MPITITSEVRRTYNGIEYVIVPDGDRVTMNGRRYPNDATALCRTIMGEDWNRGIVTRLFLGLPAYDGPRQQRVRTATVQHADGSSDEVAVYTVKGKCKHVSCYEPSDCEHGMCHNHCHSHEIGAYSGHKRPRTQEPHIGIEIEVEYQDATGFKRGVGLDDCHRDWSLGSYGAEYKLLAKSTHAANEAAELVEQLWKRRAKITRRCGLHVHLDVRQIDSARRQQLLKWLMETQAVWFSLVPPSRKNNQFVGRITYVGDSGHYTWAHESIHDTVEIRIHGGTLNPHKIAGWVMAMAHLQSKALKTDYTFPSTGDAEADFWAVFEDCPTAGKEYLTARKANGGVLRDQAFGAIEE